MSELERAIRQLRADLMHRDRLAGTTMLQAYGEVYQRLTASINLLVEQMEAAQKRGETISQAWLRREERLQALQAQTRGEMNRFAEFAAAEVVRTQRQAVEQAQADAKTLTFAGLEDVGRSVAVTGAWNRLPTETMTEIIGALSDGSPLRTLFDNFGQQASAGMRRALLTGLALGKNPRQIGRDLRGVLDIGHTRAQTISRTETLRAYRSASIKTYEENSDVVSGWRWFASLTARTCALCIAMHGKVFPFTKSFGSHPNCFPGGTLVQTPQVQGSTSRWYEGEIVEIETVSGNFFSVTPNHPILTSKGWLAAGLLHEGGDVIRTLDAQSILRTINPDYDDIPACIENVAETFGSAGRMEVRAVPTSSEDFHGDGEGSEVCIVRADGLLRDAIYTLLRQPLLEKQFIRGHSPLPLLASLGAADEFFNGNLSPSHGLMSSADIASVLLRSSLRHAEPVGVSLGSDVNLMLDEYAPDDIPTDPKLFSDLLLRVSGDIISKDIFLLNQASGAIIPKHNSLLSKNALDYLIGDTKGASELLASFAGLVATDKIVKVRRRPFSGHVHNLHTSEGWYIANNIIAHNCRCVAIPVLNNAPQITSGEEWFLTQSPEIQDRILGHKAAMAYRAGEVTLADFVGLAHSPRWGETRHVLSLAEAKFRAEIRNS